MQGPLPPPTPPFVPPSQAEDDGKLLRPQSTRVNRERASEEEVGSTNRTHLFTSKLPRMLLPLMDRYTAGAESGKATGHPSST